MSKKMDDDLEQLLENLKLRKLREILPRELEKAEKQSPSYSTFLARLLREEYQSQEMRFLEYRIRRARLPERWSLETYPWERQPGVSKAAIMQLAQLDFIDRAANLVFIVTVQPRPFPIVCNHTASTIDLGARS